MKIDLHDVVRLVKERSGCIVVWEVAQALGREADHKKYKATRQAVSRAVAIGCLRYGPRSNRDLGRLRDYEGKRHELLFVRDFESLSERSARELRERIEALFGTRQLTTEQFGELHGMDAHTSADLIHAGRRAKLLRISGHTDSRRRIYCLGDPAEDAPAPPPREKPAPKPRALKAPKPPKEPKPPKPKAEKPPKPPKAPKAPKPPRVKPPKPVKEKPPKPTRDRLSAVERKAQHRSKERDRMFYENLFPRVPSIFHLGAALNK